MFSKRTVFAVAIIIAIAILIITLAVTSRRGYTSMGTKNVGLFIFGPFQKSATNSLNFFKQIWYRYFFLVSTSDANEKLKTALDISQKMNHQCLEAELSNTRLRKLLHLEQRKKLKFRAAEVIGKDPSQWYESIVLDKGRSDGLRKGLPVIMHEGVVGIIMDVSYKYSKALLIIDRNCSIDGLIQRTRAPGVVSGKSDGLCRMKYFLPKYDIHKGDVIISSGLDGIFPKGLRIGEVSEVEHHISGFFSDVTVIPFVNFNKLEEVLIVLNPPEHMNSIEETEDAQ